jgi:hypothetical protein
MKSFGDTVLGKNIGCGICAIAFGIMMYLLFMGFSGNKIL